jgi:hypothetical protein
MKIVNTSTLVNLMKLSSQAGFRRVLGPETQKTLDPIGYHVLCLPILHNDSHIRCCLVLLKLRDAEHPLKVSLDIPTKEWNELPDMPLELAHVDDGKG